MCATSTETDTHAHAHTYSRQHVTACSVVVRFLLITLSVNKAKNNTLNACSAHARTFSFLCTSRSTLLTSSPVGAVSVQGCVRCWSRYVFRCVNIYYTYENQRCLLRAVLFKRQYMFGVETVVRVHVCIVSLVRVHDFYCFIVRVHVLNCASDTCTCFVLCQWYVYMF